MSEEIIKRLTAEDLLNSFFNKHLEQVISCWIDIQIFEKLPPNEPVGERAMPPVADGQPPMRVQIKAKDALANVNKRFASQSGILIAIEKRKRELKTLKSESEIWQKK